MTLTILRDAEFETPGYEKG